MMIPYRLYKLYKLGIPIPHKYIYFIKTMDSKMSNLRTFEILKYPDILFFMNSKNQNVLQYRKESETLIMKWSNFYSVIIYHSPNELYLDKMDDFIRSIIKDLYGIEVKYISHNYLVPLAEVTRRFLQQD